MTIQVKDAVTAAVQVVKTPDEVAAFIADAVSDASAVGATAAKQDAGLLTGPVFAITPHATNPLEREIKALAIVTGGTVVYRYPGENNDRTVTLPAGLFPFRATHIRATSTATNLTGF